MYKNSDAKQRLCQYGPESLTNAELISMILRKGKRNVSPLHVAETIDADYGTYRQLAHCQNVDDLLYRYPITHDQALALTVMISAWNSYVSIRLTRRNGYETVR